MVFSDSKIIITFLCSILVFVHMIMVYPRQYLLSVMSICALVACALIALILIITPENMIRREVLKLLLRKLIII